MVKLDLLVNGESVDAYFVHRALRTRRRQGTRARRQQRKSSRTSNIRSPSRRHRRKKLSRAKRSAPFRKDVTAKCYGATSRANASCWKSKKEGKKRHESVRHGQYPAGSV